jgi:probable rRNA maturation factor
VLSFPYDEDGGPIGDVVISIDRAAAQAAERGHGLQRELELLTLHGTLHVCGYDHETDDGEMDRLERRLRRRLVTAT